MYSFLIGDEVFIINFHKIVKKQTFFFFTNRTNKHIPYSLHIYRASSSNHPSRMLHFLWHSIPSSVDPQGDSFRHFLFSELMPAKVNTDIKENIWFCVWMYNVMSFSVINVIFMDAVIYTYFTCICDSLLSSRFLFTHEQYKPDQSYHQLCSVLGLDSSPLHQLLTLFPLSLDSLFL